MSTLGWGGVREASSAAKWVGSMKPKTSIHRLRRQNEEKMSMTKPAIIIHTRRIRGAIIVLAHTKQPSDEGVDGTDLIWAVAELPRFS